MLLGLLSSVLLLGGRAVAGPSGLWIGLILALVMNAGSYFFSDKLALSAYNAQPVSPEQNPRIWQRIGPMTKRLADRMGLPMPKLWVTPEHSPNAFATGRNPAHASVAVTVGLLELMDDEELEAVIGHELGHVLNRDILVSSIAATIAAAISFVAQMGFFFGGRSDDDEGSNPIAGLLMLFLAPFAAGVIQMAISRTREFGADAAAAKATGTPRGMVAALRKLESYSRRIPMQATEATAHMFIIKPFSRDFVGKLFSTHPSTEERIARLMGGAR